MTDDDADDEMLTLPEGFWLAVKDDPRFIKAKPEGKAFIIGGVQPTGDAVAPNDDAQPQTGTDRKDG